MSIQQTILELESKLRESAKLIGDLDQSKLMNSMRKNLNNIDQVYQEYVQLNELEYNPAEITHVEALEYAADMELRNEGTGVSYLREQFKTVPISEFQEKLTESYRRLGGPEDTIEKEEASISPEEKSLLAFFEGNVPGSLAKDPELQKILTELNSDISASKKFKASKNLEKFVKNKWDELPDHDNPRFEAMQHFSGKIKEQFGKLSQQEQITM